MKQVEDLQAFEVAMPMTLAMVSYVVVVDDHPLHLRMRPLIGTLPKFVMVIDFAKGQDSMVENLVVVVDRFVVLVNRDMGDRTFANVGGLFLVEQPMRFHCLEQQTELTSNQERIVMVSEDVVRVALDPLGLYIK